MQRRIHLLFFSFFLLGLLFQYFFMATPAHADELYKGSMEWLTLESLQTPVSTEESDIPDVYTPPAPSTLSIPELSQFNFHYPLSVKPVITTFFSSAHPGVDFAVPEGTQITAAESGIVTTAGWDTTGYGQTVVLHHAKNTYTRYAHLSEFQVSIGQYILQGMPVGLVGCTGRCTGPHLHFEVRVDDHFVDPLSLVSF